MSSEQYLKKLRKPSKSVGTLWIAHKGKAMENILANYGIFKAHVESLSQTDLQALKWAEIEGLVEKWWQGKYSMDLCVYFYLLIPI